MIPTGRNTFILFTVTGLLCLAAIMAGHILAVNVLPAMAAESANDTGTTFTKTVQSSIHGNIKTTITTTRETVIHSHDGLPRHKHVVTIVETVIETDPDGNFRGIASNNTTRATGMPGMAGTPNGTPAQMPTQPAAAASQSANDIIVMGREFWPNKLNVSVGTTVTWTNKDAEGHSIASENHTFGGGLPQGASINFTFTEPGIYNYYCELHSSMSGTVTVK